MAELLLAVCWLAVVVIVVVVVVIVVVVCGHIDDCVDGNE